MLGHHAAVTSDRKPLSSVVYDQARPSAWPLVAVFLFLIPALYCTMLLDQRTAEWLIREEHPIELAGALGLLAGSVACFLLWRDVRDDPVWPRARRWVLLGFGVLLFFGFGEEESWGQRILGIKTPTSFAHVNAQHETNLHNLTAFSGINSDTLFAVLWLVIGVIVPVLALWPKPKARLERFLPILPVELSGLFVVNQLVFWAFVAFFTRYPDTYHSRFTVAYSLVEIKETVAELLLGAAFILVLLRCRRRAAGVR